MMFNLEYEKHIRGLSLKEVLRLDAKLIKHFMNNDEFFIGVRNLLIEKSSERPKWTYENFEDIDVDLIRKFIQREDVGLRDMF